MPDYEVAAGASASSWRVARSRALQLWTALVVKDLARMLLYRDRVTASVMVYISDWAKHVIETYYGPCGLDGKLLQYLEELPKNLTMRLGKGESFWRDELDNEISKIHLLSLIEGALEFAVKMARNFSEKNQVKICYYLERSIENDWILNWLAGYIVKMEIYRNRAGSRPALLRSQRSA